MDAKKQSAFLAKFAKGENGAFDENKVGQILDFINENVPTSKRGKLLKEFLKLAKKDEFENSAKIEYCGNISEADIEKLKAFAQKELGRTLHFEKAENKQLIAGVRLKAADMLWENSSANALKNLGK